MALVQEIDCRLFRHKAILPRYQCYHKDLTDTFAKSEISSREQIPIQRVWFIWPILVRIIFFTAFQSHQYTCYLLKIIFILVNQHWLLSDMNVIQRIWYFCEIIYIPNRIYLHPRMCPVISLNTLNPRQNDRRVADGIFKCMHLNENSWTSLKFHWSLLLRVKSKLFRHWFR